MQLKLSRDIEWEDLPRIESPFFARAHVERAFYADAYGMDAVAGIDEVIREGLPGHFGPRRDAAALDWLLRRVEEGLVVLVHAPGRRPFQSVLRWEETPRASAVRPSRTGVSKLDTPPGQGQGDGGFFATRRNPAHKKTASQEETEPGHWIADPALPGPARWPIEDWLIRGRCDATLDCGKPESSWWDWLMGGRRGAKGGATQVGANVIDAQRKRSNAGDSSFVERLLPEGAPIVTIGKAIGGVAAAAAGAVRGDEGLYNAAVDGLRETQNENIDAAILLGTMGRGAGKVPQGTPAEAAQLSVAAQRGIKSLERQIAAHEAKLAEFRANPTIRPGMEHLPREVVERQQQRRIQHLEKEIQTFKENIQKIQRGEL